MVEREPTPKVRKFFRTLGFNKLPKIHLIEKEKLEVVCGESRALGCVGKDGKVYLRRDLSRILEQSTEAHELAHKILDLREVGAYTLEYWFLRKLPLGRYLRDGIHISRLLGPFVDFYIEKGTVKPWEMLYVEYMMRNKRFPRKIFMGRDEEGFVKLLSKISKLNYNESLPDIYAALRIMRFGYFSNPGEMAAFILKGVSRIQDFEKNKLVELLHSILDHMEDAYKEDFDISQHYQTRDVYLAAELRSVLYVLGHDRDRKTDFGKASEFYRNLLLPRVIGLLVKRSLHNDILPKKFFGMMNRPPAE